MTWMRSLSLGVAAALLLTACQSGDAHHSASGPALTASERAYLSWPAIPGFAGTACDLVPPQAIAKTLPPVRPGNEPGATVVDDVSLRKGTDGGGNATCAETWDGTSRQFVVDFIGRGDQSKSYEAMQVQPHRFRAGLPSELYAAIPSGGRRTVVVTVSFKSGYIELAGSAGLDVAQLSALLRIAAARATAFAPAKK